VSCARHPHPSSMRAGSTAVGLIVFFCFGSPHTSAGSMIEAFAAAVGSRSQVASEYGPATHYASGIFRVRSCAVVLPCRRAPFVVVLPSPNHDRLLACWGAWRWWWAVVVGGLCSREWRSSTCIKKSGRLAESRRFCETRSHSLTLLVCGQGKKAGGGGGGGGRIWSNAVAWCVPQVLRSWLVTSLP